MTTKKETRDYWLLTRYDVMIVEKKSKLIYPGKEGVILSGQLQLLSPVEAAKDSWNVCVKQSAKIWNVFAWKMSWNVIQNVIQAYHVATSRFNWISYCFMMKIWFPLIRKAYIWFCTTFIFLDVLEINSFWMALSFLFVLFFICYFWRNARHWYNSLIRTCFSYFA